VQRVQRKLPAVLSNYHGLDRHLGREPADADPAEVPRQIVRIVDLPFGKRPFRVHIDPSQDGAEIVNAGADRMRREMYRNIGLENLLHPVVAS
jgi:hypothetical protein